MRRRFLSIIFVLCVLVSNPVLINSLLGDQPVALESIMSAAFPTNLAVLPKGNLVAWVFNEQGKRNIWVAKAPGYQAVRLTAYSEDDGQDISALTFSSDGSVLLYVRGGDANHAGEYPNPTSNTEGVKQEVWAVRVSGGEPWRIGEGRSPLPSPTEPKLVFLCRGQIYLASLEGEPKPQPLFKVRGSCGQPAWSPDSAKLAFVSSRGDHSFIGVYRLDQKSIQWVAPSVDEDVNPVFSPDGTRLAFFRFPGSTSTPSFDEGRLFWIMVADVASGLAKEIWKCPDQSGGFAQNYPASPLQWTAGGRLLFYSEHEGWMRIYSIPAEGGAPVGLTPAGSEVEDCSLSPDRKTLIFNSNSGDIDRRHLWRVPVTGGEPELLTGGTGIEWAPAWISGGMDLVFFCSTAFQPAAPAIMKLAEKTRRLIAPETIPANFPAAKSLVEPIPVAFKAGDGLEIHGQLFLPAGAKPGDSRPAVIFMHGGPMRQMLLGWHMRGYYHNAYAFNQYLTSLGYVVLSVNYRSGIGYGRAFREAARVGFRGASEYQDIVAAGKYLQDRPEVNPHKIGLWGGSYGGYLTALGLARDSQLFAAGVDLHGVHDWAVDFRSEGARWRGWGEEVTRLAYDSSPVADVRFWYSPVLMIHGDDDRNVDFFQTVDLVQRLRKEANAHVETIVFPDEVHSFLLHRHWLEVFRASADFFSRFLKGTASAPGNN